MPPTVMADKEAKVDVGQKKHSKGKGKDRKDSGGVKTSKNEIVQESLAQTLNEKMKSEAGNAIHVKDDVKASEGDNKSEKSREEILALREAKKLAKQAKKGKIKGEVSDPSMKPDLTPNDKLSSPKESSKNVKENCSQPKVKVPADIINIESKVTPKMLGPDVPTTTDQTEGKSKSQLRAERRAKQEAERAKKLEKAKPVIMKNVNDTPHVIKSEKPAVKVMKPATQQQDKIHKVKLFAHLYTESLNFSEIDLYEGIHPCILRLGTQYRSKVISGANARCLALLNALKTLVNDYQTPPNQEFSRGLESDISKGMIFLNKCRPVAVSMVNVIKHMKFQINQLKGSENECKQQLNEWIDTYIKEQIEKAAEAISLFVLQKISDGDVILTYSCSSLIQRILIKAHEKNIKFRVIVVDGRPWLEGKEMLRRLVKAGISCTYVFFNGLSFIMPEVTKILLGAHALLANGYVMSRAGSSQIALMAKTYNVPVLVCCETHKFSEKVQTDSFVHNELGDPDKLISNKGCNSKELSKWKAMQYLTPLNLTYDVTPPDLVSAVVTEIAVLPCTSVPVILRIKPPDISC